MGNVVARREVDQVGLGDVQLHFVSGFCVSQRQWDNVVLLGDVQGPDDGGREGGREQGQKREVLLDVSPDDGLLCAPEGDQHGHQPVVVELPDFFFERE